MHDTHAPLARRPARLKGALRAQRSRHGNCTRRVCRLPWRPHETSLFPVALLVLTGCATAALPAERLTSLEASIRSADEVAAGQQPQASLHVRLAEEELATARKLAKDGDADRAELFLQMADVDAALALALTRAADAKHDAETAQAAVAALSEGKTP